MKSCYSTQKSLLTVSVKNNYAQTFHIIEMAVDKSLHQVCVHPLTCKQNWYFSD